MLFRSNQPKVDNRFEATVVWMSEQPLVPGRQYLFKQTTKVTPGAVNTLRYRIDVNTLHRQDAPSLGLNEIGRCAITLAEPIMHDAYRRNRATGSFIMIDRLTNATVGAGMILDREPEGGRSGAHWDDAVPEGVHGTASAVTATERQARYGQTPMTVLLVGPTGSGKSTLLSALERRLFEAGRAVAVLDGQSLRTGISRDLGFSAADRSENLRRGAEIARLFNDAGLVCLAGFVAPEEAVRRRAAERIEIGRAHV